MSTRSAKKEMLDHLKKQQGLSGAVASAGQGKSPLVPDPEKLYEPFGLTDVQEAYWLGRTTAFNLGGVASHGYQEFELDFTMDALRLQQAWGQVIQAHPMLRAVIQPDGMQRILAEVPEYQMQFQDLRRLPSSQVELNLNNWRREMSHQCLPSDQWPLFDVRLSLLPGGKSLMHVSSDALISDVYSDLVVHRDLKRIYENPQEKPVRPGVSFRDYVLAEEKERQSDQYKAAAAYWHNKLDDLPPSPLLPLAVPWEKLGTPRFERLSAQLEEKSWQTFQQKARTHGLTPTLALLTVFAEVLRLWSTQPDFTINLTLFNRKPLHPDIGEVVGDFTSTMLMGIKEPQEPGFEARALKLQGVFLDDFEHSLYSGMRVLRDLARQNGATGRMFMPVVFTSALSSAPGNPSLQAGKTFGKEVLALTQTPQVLIDHQVYQQDGQLVINWDMVPSAFPAGLAQTMFDALVRAVRSLAREKSDWTKRLQVPLPEADQKLVERLNQTQLNIEPETLHQGVWRQIRQRPDDPAVINGLVRLTYGELGQWCQAVQNALGRVQGGMVAVVMSKGWQQVAAVLGVLSAGATYVPLDPVWPLGRLKNILNQVDPVAVLTAGNALSGSDLGTQCPVTNLDDLSPAHCIEPSEYPPSDQTAYVIFTSGSTGRPKGVVMEHGAAHNTVLDINRRFKVGPTDAVLGISSLCFDLSVYDIFGLLSAGGRLVIPEPGHERNPAHWMDSILREKVTVWNTVPAIFQMLIEYSGGELSRADCLRLAMLSGDWIPLDLPKQAKRLLKNTALVSLGGATEAGIWSIFHPIESLDPAWPSVPYGKPLSNQTFYVLDHNLRIRPVWAEGELYIGGQGLARGYLGDPDKTDRSFIHNPHSGQRLYRTGDMGRLHPDGNIEFLGRRDGQVKINGHRVELGEIEFALGLHPKVDKCLVNLTPVDSGRGMLAAYVVARQAIQPDELKEHLGELLPNHMIPSAFVFLEEFPLSPNGKVDRKALPLPDFSARGVEDRPEDDLEVLLCGFTDEVLGLKETPVSANLFDLGATSLEVIALHRLIEKEHPQAITLVEMFQAGSLRRIARAMRRQSGESAIHVKASQRAERRRARSIQRVPI